MGKINYQQTGSGDAILLIHGWMHDHTVWSGLVQVLKQHFTVITPDLTGFGSSDRDLPPAGKKMLEHLTEELHRWLEGLDLQFIGVVGHSMGGVITLELLRRFNYHFPKVIISDSPYCGLPKWITLLSRYRRVVEHLFSARGILPDRVTKPGIRALSKITIRDTSTLPESYYKMIRRGDTLYAAGLLKELADYRFPFNFKPEIDRALVIRGAHDRLVTTGALKVLAEFLDGRYREIPDIAHAPMIEAPIVFQEIITSFFLEE